jgi:hypothetical protein
MTKIITTMVNYPGAAKPAIEIKQKSDTKVTFKTVIGILGDTSKALTEHLLTVSELHDSCLNAFGLSDTGTVTFIFADDMEDKVYDGLQILKNSPYGELEIDITYFQRNSTVPIRTLRLVNPTISGIKLSKLECNKLSDDYLNIKVDVTHTGFTKI